MKIMILSTFIVNCFLIMTAGVYLDTINEDVSSAVLLLSVAVNLAWHTSTLNYK